MKQFFFLCETWSNSESVAWAVEFRRPRAYLLYLILANSKAREAGHVAGHSRPSDRPSCFSLLFCKKILELKRNQPAVQVSLSGNFAKKPSAFLEINPQSNSAGWRKFTNKTLSSHKINLTSLSSLRVFFKKNPQILIELNHNLFHPLLPHEQHYTYNLNTKTCWNQKLLNIKFNQEFKNYNFIIEQILKFKILSQFI